MLFKTNSIGEIEQANATINHTKAKIKLYNVHFAHYIAHKTITQSRSRLMRYAFWNNKGGTGKTSLSFQVICRYAEKNPGKSILVIDLCPQANLSELLLGGLTGNGSNNLLQRQGLVQRCSIGGYFQTRLPAPYNKPAINSANYITRPSSYNSQVAENISLVCGDPLLELQANAINTLSAQTIPGVNAWASVISWIEDLIEATGDEFDDIFFDCNPSFSIYTQIGLSSAEKIVLPVMADESSRRAIQNAISLIYGLKLPSDIYAAFAFSTKMEAAGKALPKVHIVAKNRLTQYMGPASAYAAVLDEIDSDINELLRSNPEIFTFNKSKNGMVNIRDFQTTGVVSYARGCPFSKLTSGYKTIGSQRVRVNEDYRLACQAAIDSLVKKL